MFWNKKPTAEPAEPAEPKYNAREARDQACATLDKFIADLKSGTITIEQACAYRLELPENIRGTLLDSDIRGFFEYQRMTLIMDVIKDKIGANLGPIYTAAAASEAAAPENTTVDAQMVADLHAAGLSKDEIDAALGEINAVMQ